MSDWIPPPTRRELTLLLFCVAVFIVAFNASASLRLIGLNSYSLIPFSSHSAPLGSDGRRLEGYRDHLENEIFGEWGWEPGRIAGVKEAESSRLLHGKTHDHPNAYIHGEGLTGERAMWLVGVGEGRYGNEEGLGSTSVNDGFVRWGEDVPRTELRQHIPGFTILDNVTMLSGTFYIVVDDPRSMPPIQSIASSRANPNHPPRDIDWQILPVSSAPGKFGSFGGRIHGVTFISYDGPSMTDVHTFPSLVRLYSTLNVSSPQSLSPPNRIFFPGIFTFTDPRPDPDPDGDSLRRQRASIGVAPQTLKAAYPSLATAQFAEDFGDFASIGVPVLLDRVVLADRGAARRDGLPRGMSAWMRPFASLRVSKDWFEPVRRTLAEYFLCAEDESPAMPDAGTHTVTYLSRQDGVEGERLRAADHAALVEALQNLARTGVHVHVLDENVSWEVRMRAIVQSTIVLSVFGDHLADAMFMKRTPRSTVMEFFPPSEFNREWEVVMRSMGIRYVAWQGNRKYTIENLPMFSQSSSHEDFALDSHAVVRTITDTLNEVAAH
ncbi:hypothetical protein F5148DRAFT_1203591 [Russula earlei]|uniref:Uncharacterized protein n=1 Tax=Russula earlei TaxID=71964 RepID=A0ACC0U7U7_9AGAM|nr:hypothetical protein F5148DRAFT_1203591 [Russula earlei]